MPLPSIPEYSTSIKIPALVHPSVLDGGHPIENGIRLIKYSGGFCVVFPFETATNKYAVRCWHAEVSNAKHRTRVIAEALQSSNLPYFVGFDYYEDGIMTPQGIQPIVVMDWVDARALKKFLADNIHNSQRINDVADNFKNMVTELHKHSFSHGDLQHGNIMVRQDNSLVLVDYDSMYVPALNGMTDDIKGLAGYQHKSRWNNKFVTEKADYFSELIIYLSLKALAKYPDLWFDLRMEDTETLLFSGDDLESRGTSSIFRILKLDRELEPMVEKLCEFLRKDSLGDLQPLEEIFISKVEIIAEKWRKSPPIAQQKPTIIEDPNKISDQWRKGNGYNESKKVEKEQEMLINSISQKFKNPK